MYNSDYNDDKIVQCPFNKYHTMPSSSLQRHIVKCEKNYPRDYKVICPYNATHRLSKCEIEEHINTCPTRNIVEASCIQQPTMYNMTKLQDEYDLTSTIDNKDTWDYWKEEMRSRNKFAFIDRDNESVVGDSVVESLPSTMGIGRGRVMPSYVESRRRNRF